MDTDKVIEAAFAELADTDRDCLMHAFDNLIPQYVKLADNRFIGTHVSEDPSLNIEFTNGFWFVGTLKR